MMRMGKRSVDTDTAESADRIYRSLMKKRQTASMMRMGKRGGKYYGSQCTPDVFNLDQKFQRRNPFLYLQ